jgi:hypothetical protein
VENTEAAVEERRDAVMLPVQISQQQETVEVTHGGSGRWSRRGRCRCVYDIDSTNPFLGGAFERITTDKPQTP